MKKLIPRQIASCCQGRRPAIFGWWAQFNLLYYKRYEKKLKPDFHFIGQPDEKT